MPSLRSILINPLLQRCSAALTQSSSSSISQAQTFRPHRPVWQSRLHEVSFYGLSLLSMTVAHGIRYFNEPQLMVGSYAPQTVLAPASVVIEDPQATQARRSAARERTPQALQIDPNANLEMQKDLRSLLDEVDRARILAGPLPYLSTDLLSLPTQARLRQISQPQTDPANLDPRARQEISSLGDETYQQILPQIEAAQDRYQQARARLLLLNTSPALLDLDPLTWEQMRRASERTLYRLQAVGIAAGLPATIRQQGILAQTSDTLLSVIPDPRLRLDLETTMAVWLGQTVRPNLQVDDLRTSAQVEAAMQAVDPVTIAVNQGQVIVKAGQEITPESFLILDHFKLTQRGINVWGLANVAGLMGIGLIVFVPLRRRCGCRLRNGDRLLVLLLLLTVAPLASTFGVQFSSLPAVGLLVSSFYGTGLGLMLVAGEALLLPLVTSVSVVTLLPLVAGSVVACMAAGRLRSREELALLGGGAALTQVVCQGILSLVTGGGLDLASIALAGGTGLGWSIIALGASPYLERIFDLITPIRLLELANPNRALLRRLATDAPGTFQHTLFVATLAERAAQRLNLNVELVRTGTLYHDIGKMLHAQYFIENQMGNANPHVALDDPYESARIIKAHVSDGLRLARQYHLPTAIQAFIPEHQGTIRIAYFYHQAQIKAGGQPVPEDPFRYDGPIPQSRETGIVMLADACEAGLRSLSSGGECLSCGAVEEAKAMVHRIFTARWADGQLADSGLSHQDLEVATEAFVEVWRQSNHERIPYPKPLDPPLSAGPVVAVTASHGSRP